MLKVRPLVCKYWFFECN